MDTKEKLNLLSEFMAQKDLLDLQKRELIDRVYTPEIRAKVADIEAEFTGKSATVDENIELLKADIEADVLKIGKSVEGDYMRCEWRKGRAGGWDGKKLEGFAASHPEIMQFKKPDGDPSVAFVTKK